MEQGGRRRLTAGDRSHPQEFSVLHNYRLRRTELSFEARQRVLPEILRPIFASPLHPSANVHYPLPTLQIIPIPIPGSTLLTAYTYSTYAIIASPYSQISSLRALDFSIIAYTISRHPDSPSRRD